MPEFFVVGLPRAIGPLYIPEGMSERGEGEAPLVPPSSLSLTRSLARFAPSLHVFSSVFTCSSVRVSLPTVYC